jgi:hypothetical protein
MLQDPALAPWVQEGYGWWGSVLQTIQRRTGVGAGEWTSLFRGELTIGLAEGTDQPALILLVDFGEEESRIQEILATVEKTVQSRGARLSTSTLAGIPVRVLERQTERTERLYYTVLEKTLLGASDSQVLETMLVAWAQRRANRAQPSQETPSGGEASTKASNGKSLATLQDSLEFNAVLAECRKIQKERPLLFWYVDPLNLLRVVGREDPNIQFVLLLAPIIGLDGISGAGGAVSAAIGPLDWFTQSHLLLPTPRVGALGLLSFGAADYTPPRWVPGECTNYFTVSWRLDEALQAVRTILDGFRGEGSLARDLNRVSRFLGVDLEKELLPVLTGRIVTASYVDWPARRESRAQLTGLEVRDEAKAKEVVTRISERFANLFTKEAVGQYEFFVAERPLGPQQANLVSERRVCFGVLGGWILIADRKSAYQRAITTLEGVEDSLAQRSEFRELAARIDERVDPLQLAMMTFENPKENVRYLFELTQTDEGRRLLEEAARGQRIARAIVSLLNKQGLPPFAAVERYLVPQGSVLLSDETGLHYLTFSFRKAPEGSSAN